MRHHLARALVALAVASALLFVVPQRALACECPTRPAPRAALDDSNAVFVGTVEMVRQPQPELRLQRRFPFILYDTPPHAGLTIRLAVAQVWRGPAYRTVTLSTGRAYSGCGVPFVEGGTYLVYAYINGAGDLMTHRCSRTAPVGRAGEDLALFGAGRPPSRDEPWAARPRDLAWAICGVALVAAIGAGGYALQRRRRRVVS